MEKIYVIPLRKAFRKPFTKRAPYAMRLVKEFIKRHTKVEEVKIGKHLNEEIWKNGIRSPPRRVKVKVVIEDKTAKAELFGYEYVEFKAEKPKTPTPKEKLMQRLGAKAIEKQKELERIEGKKSKKSEDSEEKKHDT